ncbi:NADH-quinone oxidoreductase subunit A, partial [Bienertia sinuspersici]
EKCSFDDPGGKEQTKRKYFNDIRLKTKEERLENKPSEMKEIEWKFLVDHWSDEKKRARKQVKVGLIKRCLTIMGLKSLLAYDRKSYEKNKGKCSRVDVLVASRTRKSKKAVNAITLEKNTLAVDEIKKLKEQRDQGLNDKTDEKIF